MYNLAALIKPDWMIDSMKFVRKDLLRMKFIVCVCSKYLTERENHIKLAANKDIFCKVPKTRLFKLAYL